MGSVSWREWLALNNDAKNLELVPLEVIRDLWIAKFGNEWVSPAQLDSFYEAALMRLRAENWAQRTTLQNHVATRYRIAP